MIRVTQRATNLVASCALALVGAAAVAGAVGFGVFEEGGQVGPGFLPAAAGGALLVLAGVDVAHRVAESRRASDSVPAAEEAGQAVADVDVYGRDQRTRTRQLVLVVAGIVVAAALAPVLGLLPSLGILMGFIAIVVERRKWLPSLIVTAATVAVLYLVFDVFLGIPLPMGLIGGLLP